MRANLPDLVGELTTLEGVEDVALTTNGMLLAQHAAELKANGLQRVTVSLDSLDDEVFRKMSGGFGGSDEVLEGITRRAQMRASRRSRSTRSSSAVSTITPCSTWSSTSAAPASSCASSSTWTSATATTGAWIGWSRRAS